MKHSVLMAASLLVAVGCGKAPAPQSFQPAASASSGGPAAVTAAPSDPVKPSALSPMGSADVVRHEARVIAIPAGTSIQVRLAVPLDTARNRAGDTFTATLDQPLEVDGRVIVPKGTAFSGHVMASHPSGRLRGRAGMGLRLDSFTVNGKTHEVSTSAINRVSAAHKTRNLALIGGGSGLGAILGAVAGGGRGALIGAGAGAAAGTTGAALTGKREVAFPVETPLTFTLQAPVRL